MDVLAVLGIAHRRTYIKQRRSLPIVSVFSRSSEAEVHE